MVGNAANDADTTPENNLVSSEAIQAIREALELAGIEFIDENGGSPGVRLRKRQRLKKPK